MSHWPCDFSKRTELIDYLRTIGVCGAAAEAIANETAVYRHFWRVGKAETAASEWAENIPMENQPNDARRTIAALLCMLDRCGVGGRHGVEGDSTARVPVFCQLGKGRKHATDGGAWTAAIKDAQNYLDCDLKVYPAEDGLSITGLYVSGQLDIPADILVAAGVGAQSYTLAREGLRLSIGMAPRLPNVLETVDPLPCEWANACNAILAAMSNAEPK